MIEKIFRQKNKILVGLLSLFLLTSCGQSEEKEAPEVVNLEEESETKEAHESVDLDEISAFLYEKLDGQKLARNYGEDTGWTNIEFSSDGKFTGSYMGKTSVDGFDGGRNWKAQAYYLGEEIHSSNFEGRFTIVKQMNDYVYMMKLEDFEITSEYGLHDDIYFNVDFAIGMREDADYYLYIPGTPGDLMPGEDSRLDNSYKREEATEDKSEGFIIWEKYDDEVFNQLGL